MTDKQIKLDGSFIPIEEAIKAGLISEKDIDVPSKRPPYEIVLMHDHILRLEEELQAKEQECEELKHQIEDVDTLCSEKESLIDKYLQTLTEIKEIAERGFKHSQCNCGAKADLDLILQKISECEGNDE